MIYTDAFVRSQKLLQHIYFCSKRLK